MRSPLSYLPLASGFLVLVLSLAIAVITVTSKGGFTTPQNLSTKAAEATASLSLSPATGGYAYTPGQSYPLGIVVDSAGKNVDGVDVIVTFDPKKVRVEGPKLTTTNMFEEFPVNRIDNANGKIQLSALTFTPKPMTGILGTFSITPLVKGDISLAFSFTPGSTTDSNIAENKTAKDILGKVENGKYTFR